MFRFSIDRGGTFTDVYAECPGGKIRVMKLLSEDPANYQDAPREAIRRILQEVSRLLTMEVRAAAFQLTVLNALACNLCVHAMCIAHVHCSFFIQELGVVIPSDELLDSAHIDWIRMGTTVATNALLERKGERMALVITGGFRDLLHIGNQSRPSIFDLVRLSAVSCECGCVWGCVLCGCGCAWVCLQTVCLSCIHMYIVACTPTFSSPHPHTLTAY